MCDELYEFNKEYFLHRIHMDALAIEHAESESSRDEARNRMLSIVKDLADAYEAAIKNLNAIELTKSRRSKSGETEDKENRFESKPVCKFTYETMSARCKRSLGKGFYYIFLKSKFEILKEDCERKEADMFFEKAREGIRQYAEKKKDAVERCFG